MINVNVSLIGDKQLMAQLKKLDSNFGSWKPELKLTGEYLKGFYSVAVFASSGGIFGARWSALNPAYEYWKRKNYPGAGILVRTGDMQRSYRYEVADTFMELRNISKYAGFHQTGTSKMPQRLLTKVDAKRKDDIMNIFKQGIIDRLKNL